MSRPTFYSWYELYRRFGTEALADQRGGRGRVRNRIPNSIRDQVLEMAFGEPDLSSRELAIKFIDEPVTFNSEVSVTAY